MTSKRTRELLVIASLGALLLGLGAAASSSDESSGEGADAWGLYAEKHWQRESKMPDETPEATDEREGTRGSCEKPGMVRVEGKMVSGQTWGPDVSQVGMLQDQACAKWLSKKPVMRCAHFDKEKLDKLLLPLPRKPMAFCIDRYEFPNVKGENPVIMMTYYEAGDLCKARGERLCTDEEWTFACEGESAQPYPYGYDRDDEACNADNPEYVTFNQALVKLRQQYRQERAECTDAGSPTAGQLDRSLKELAALSKLPGMAVQNELSRRLTGHRTSDEAAEILESLWAGEPSGARPGCRSPFGVYDLTGNVDEWTTNRISGSKYKGAQKGGYWGPIRARCRPATVAHDEGHMFYQQGTRCCSDH